MELSTPSFGFFEPDMLATLEQTFNATWPVLRAQGEAELKFGLSQTLVAESVTDELQKLAFGAYRYGPGQRATTPRRVRT